MARDSIPLGFASAVVVTPGTSVAPSFPIPSNTTNVLIRNKGPQEGIIGIGAPGTPLTDGVNGFAVPNGGVLTLPINTQSIRGIMDQSEQAGSGIIYDVSAPGGCTFSILYLNVLAGG